MKKATQKGKKRLLLTPTTFCLIHSADFADRYERQILPLLRAGCIVLCDRYYYTAFARDITRGCNPEWVQNLYSFAVKPDITFWFRVPLEVALGRILGGRQKLKHFEAGMDMRLADNERESFAKFQALIHQQYGGRNFTAGEIGHMALSAEDGPKCGCGNRGCFEAFAGRLGLVRRISAEMKNEKGDTPLHRLLAEEKDHKIKSNHIAKALHERDPIVTKAVNGVAEHLGVAIVNVMHLLNPDAIVLGGGVMQSFGDYVMPRVKKTVKRRGIPVCCDGVQLVGTKLGDDAGILGASVVAWTSLAAKTKRS